MAESIQALLADLWSDSPTVRPHSPTIRPVKQPMFRGVSPLSPVSPWQGAKSIRPATGKNSPGFRPDSPQVRPIQTHADSGLSPHSPLSPMGTPVTRSAIEFVPLTDSQLAELIATTARGNDLDSLALWCWCDELTIEAIRSGDPVELRAFKACVESAVVRGTLLPDGGHSLPFLGEVTHQSTTAESVRCCDCQHQDPTNHPALVSCKADVQASSACGLWWSTDRHQCGRFKEKTAYQNHGIAYFGPWLSEYASPGSASAAHS